MDETLVARQHDGPVDAASAARLEERGLRLTRLRNEDRAEYEAWQSAVMRGFLEHEPSEEQRAAGFERMGYRRLVAVLDDAGVEPAVPVATLGSWVGELTVPDGVLDSCGISSVTVSPTHRRRGIARALLEGELRTAAALGLPIASLTVSESPLYGRYGFAPAADVSSLVLDVKRASWTGPTAPGRLDFIPRERWRELAPDLFDEVRRSTPGEFTMPGGHWDRFAGTRPDADKPGRLRAVQYADPEGRVTGLALYSVTENHDDYTKSTVDVSSLIVADDEAYAALWRFFVEMDLIGTLRANEVSVDEPLLWMIADRRAATITVVDHHYVRVLDVARVLTSRRYAAPGRFVLRVDDPLGIGGGTYVLTVGADGAAAVVADAPEDAEAVEVTLGIAELSALVLGQVSALTLESAGRLRTSDARALTRTFRWDEPARLSYWY